MKIAYHRILNTLKEAQQGAANQIKRYETDKNDVMITHYKAMAKDAQDMSMIITEHQQGHT